MAMAPSPVALMSFGCSSLSASSLIQSGSPRAFRVPSISITSGAANPRFPCYRLTFAPHPNMSNTEAVMPEATSALAC